MNPDKTRSLTDLSWLVTRLRGLTHWSYSMTALLQGMWSRGWMNSAFSARHKGICIWVLTQQITSIAKPFRENTAALVLFNISTWRSYSRATQGSWRGRRRVWWMGRRALSTPRLLTLPSLKHRSENLAFSHIKWKWLNKKDMMTFWAVLMLNPWVIQITASRSPFLLCVGRQRRWSGVNTKLRDGPRSKLRCTKRDMRLHCLQIPAVKLSTPFFSYHTENCLIPFTFKMANSRRTRMTTFR